MSDRTSQYALRSYRRDDRIAVLALLENATLPVDDLRHDILENFIVAELGRNVVGLVGVQPFESVGLLRSLVVQSDGRGGGLGSRLVHAIEQYSRTMGINELWLLTIDADRFFVDRGFEVCERDIAPKSIQSTTEFSELCPADAKLMRKVLF